jgi:DNA primase
MFRFGIAKSTKKVGERLKRASDVVIDPEKEKNYKKLGVGLTNPYKKYLEGRGLDWRFVSRMFKLRCINYAHKYRSRIIIPVIQNDVEVSWVSRSILDDPSVRYVNCPKADEVISLKETLFNMDNTANTVLVTEGAFDVMAVGHGCVSTLGVKYTPVQLDMLKSYRRVFIWYDPDKSGMRAAEKLASDLGYHVSVEILESDMDLSETNKHYPDEIIKIKRELLL